MRQGTIINVVVGKGYGFIFEKPGAPDLFFCYRDLVELEFGERLKEMRVQFDVLDSERGPRAVNVQPADAVPVSHKVQAAK